MKNSMKAGALFVAGIFALSGCGSSAEGSESDSAGSSPAASKSASPSPTLAVGQEQYEAAELVAALDAVNAAQGGTGEISDDAAMRDYLQQQGFSEGVTVSPAQCEEIASFVSFFGDVDEANIASLKLDTRKLTVVSHSDADTLDSLMQDNAKLADECSGFEMGDEEFTAVGATESLEVSTEAPTTQAFTMTVSAEGETLSGLKVSSASGTTNIVVTDSDAANPDEASAEAAELIDAVLEQLQK